MKSGDICKKSGQYCCGYHQKNKIKIKEGSAYPDCNYNGLRCEGFWCFLKAIKEKTHDEIVAANIYKAYRPRRDRSKEPDYYAKWLKEKASWDDWKKW